MYQGLQMDIFIRELKILLNSLVVKRNKLADSYETLEIEKSAEMYLMVKDGMDDFSSYVNFDYDVYKAAGISDGEISDYQKDKNSIPYGIRSSLIKLEREYILSKYVEKNNYYRMLAGLPDIDDTDLIYVPANDYDISTNIPIHQLDTTNMSRLMASGLLTTIVAAHPTKKYLNYLGDYSISYYKARKALNYELLRCSTTDPDNITFDFKKFYSNAREYYMNGMYNPNLANTYKYYDNFIGFCIVIMAVQRLFGNVFKQGITREFYDTQLIRYLFESYNIPYITDMTLAQMKILAKNLNIFLSIKSSTKVLFDLCSIFGFSNINIYKYLLVRDHVMDSVTGKPIFPTKTTANGAGTFTTVPDYAQMYEIYFQKVNVKAKDINASLEDKSNKVPYASMVTGDIYWVDDDELRDKIYKAAVNHIESKYISMDIMFKITAMMYEICHTFRMIIDNHKEFSKITISVPKVSTKQQDLFSLIIFLCATFCKKYGFNGEIPLKPASIAYVYGFNFNADIPKIIADVLNNKYIDDSVAQYMINFSVTSSKDVDRIYKNIKKLKDFIVEQMANTKDVDVYHAYKALYKSALVVQDKETIYKKSDGTFASTYKDFLEYLSPELNTVLDNMSINDTKHMDEIMEHILYKMEDLCTEYKYLHTAVESNSLFTVLIKLVRLFKSYTVDLTSAGIQYLFDDRYFNMMKILDQLAAVNVEADLDDRIHLLYYDTMVTMHLNIPEEDRLKMYVKFDSLIKQYFNDYIRLKDKVGLEEVFWTGFKSDLSIEYSDDFDILPTISHDEKVKLVDKLTEGGIDITREAVLKFKTAIQSALLHADESTKLFLLDRCKIAVTKNPTENIKVKDTVSEGVIVKNIDRKLLIELMEDTITDILKKDVIGVSDDMTYSSDYPVGTSDIAITDKLKMTVTV